MSGGPTLDELQRAGFPAGAEPLVAIDLADTLVTVTDPPTDLLADTDQEARWWALQSARLPDGRPAPRAATRRVRSAVRDLFDAIVEGREPVPSSLDDLTAASASAPTSRRLGYRDGAFAAETRWHTEDGGHAGLAHIAREAIDLVGDPDQAALLRRCANPACSMLFLATNPRRQWCTANICGNRARVARHYDRNRSV